MQLSEYLAPEQIRDIHLLAKQREWTSLLFLARKLYDLSKEELAAFNTTDQAIERKGKAAGIKLFLDAISSTYIEVHKANAGTSINGNSTDPIDSDSAPTSNAY